MNKDSLLNPKDVFLKSILPIIYLIVALLAVRSTIVEPYVVPSGSMEPTLKIGDRLYALKCAYDVRIPFTDIVLFRTGKMKRGDVILFKYPYDPSKTYVKRLVGLPGDKIDFDNGRLFVNGEEVARDPHPDPKLMSDIEGLEPKTLYVETLGGVRHYVIMHDESPRERENGEDPERMKYRHKTVPPNMFFAMGDNRDNSSDSRFWGFAPMENMKGRAMFIWFSLDDNWKIRPERIGTPIQ